MCHLNIFRYSFVSMLWYSLITATQRHGQSCTDLPDLPRVLMGVFCEEEFVRRNFGDNSGRVGRGAFSHLVNMDRGQSETFQWLMRRVTVFRRGPGDMSAMALASLFYQAKILLSWLAKPPRNHDGGVLLGSGGILETHWGKYSFHPMKACLSTQFQVFSSLGSRGW